MAAECTLPEDDEAPRQDIGALDRDRYRNLHVRRAEEVRRSHADTLAAGDVHGVDDDAAASIGEVILRDRREHGRLLAAVDHPRDQLVRRVHRV